jgi:hypothetical protein
MLRLKVLYKSGVEKCYKFQDESINEKIHGIVGTTLKNDFAGTFKISEGNRTLTINFQEIASIETKLVEEKEAD